MTSWNQELPSQNSPTQTATKATTAIAMRDQYQA